MSRPSAQRVAYWWLEALRIRQRGGEYPTAFWRGAVLDLCRTLGVNPGPLKVEFKTRLPAGDASYYGGTISIRNPVVATPGTLRRILEGVAHELQHAKQDQSGALRREKRDAGLGWLFEGTWWPPTTPYKQRPWEIEGERAERHGAALFDKMKAQGKLPVSNTEQTMRRAPYTGPTMGDLSELSNEEFRAEMAHRKRDPSGWLEKWRVQQGR